MTIEERSANRAPGIATLWVIFVAMDGAAQILFKYAAINLPEPAPTLAWLYLTVTSPRVWAALGCLAAVYGVWMMILRRMPLATAFPITASTYVVVVVAAHILYGETIAPIQYAGIALIVVGVALLRPGH
ncbi:MAG TPA: EamA family transporter [Casimicrobiaceae bacterium]|nr:EamA family transporter [Casimicrobiaceae bacterium]